MKTKEEIFEAIKNAGYKYTKDYYEGWSDIFADELKEEDSYYYDSLNKEGFPFKEKLGEQVDENAHHFYCNSTTNEFFDEFEIGKFTKEEMDSVAEVYLYDYFIDGIEKFIKDTYK